MFCSDRHTAIPDVFLRWWKSEQTGSLESELILLRNDETIISSISVTDIVFDD